MASIKQLWFLHLVIFLVLSLQGAEASANWDGPADAAIDQLAAFLNNAGLRGAGVRPFGYGFEITRVAPAEEPDSYTTVEEGGEEEP